MYDPDLVTCEYSISCKYIHAAGCVRRANVTIVTMVCRWACEEAGGDGEDGRHVPRSNGTHETAAALLL